MPNLYASFDPDEIESSKRFYPRWTGQWDKQGIPVYVFHIASLTELQKELNIIPEDCRYQRIIALHEVTNRFSHPFCSALPHPADKDSLIMVQMCYVGPKEQGLEYLQALTS